jgi:hypothetical protein
MLSKGLSLESGFLSRFGFFRCTNMIFVHLRLGDFEEPWSYFVSRHNIWRHWRIFEESSMLYDTNMWSSFFPHYLLPFTFLLIIQLRRPATLTSCVELYFSYSLSQFWEEACRDKLNDVIQVISKWFPVRYLDFDTFVESGMQISWWSSTGRCWLRKKLQLPEQIPEIKINKELSHTILGVNLRNLSYYFNF